MEAFAEYLSKIDNPSHRDRMEEVLTWVTEQFPNLVPVVKWNQPMFTDHDTYIIGFSLSKQHIAVAPEEAGMIHFAADIEQSGYSFTKGLVRMKWSEPINYELLEKMIAFNIEDKQDCTTFWRK